MQDISELKRRLPMPQLMAVFGFSDRAKKSALCVFHNERNPSFGIFEGKNGWRYKCHSCGASGDEIDFIQKVLGLSKAEAIKRYAELAGVSPNGAKPPSEPAKFTLEPLTSAEVTRLAKWRGYSESFVIELLGRGVLGVYTDQSVRCIAFPVAGGCHYKKKDGSWRYSLNAKAELFAYGAIEKGESVHCFESQWCALAFAEASGEENNIVSTRGAANGKLIAQRFKGHTGTLYLWKQNDAAGEKWARDIREALPDQRIRLAAVPKEHKDLNDWRKAGATSGDVFNVFLSATDFPAPVSPVTPSKTLATAQPLVVDVPKLAYEPDILARLRKDIRACGVVGEEQLAETIYLLITSRLLDKPVSAAVKGLSSSGKSFTTEKVVEFFPKEAVINMTAMSQRALVYSDEDYKHRTIVLFEATGLREGAEDDLTSYFVRSLLSEGRINYSVTVRDQKENRFKTENIVKEGPVNLIITTTKTRVHAENETRLLSLNTNDTPEQTKAIFEALATERSDSVDKTEWHKLQEWLQKQSGHSVTIPYADQLAKLVPPVAVRLRRDFGALLALIKTHALLHQATRNKDAKGRIVATIEDYKQVRELVAPIMSEGVGATVSPVVRETVDAVESASGDSGATALVIAERLKLDKGTVSRRLSVAASQGYVRNLEEKRGKPGRWVKGDPLPDERNLLPEPSALLPVIDAGCTVAANSKLYIETAPSSTERCAA